jgi:hypothetical protein
MMKEHGVLDRCLLLYEEGIRCPRAHSVDRVVAIPKQLGIADLNQFTPR